MLILLRRCNEALILGGGDSGFPLIEILVTRIEKHPPTGGPPQVKLGITAPKSVPVHRLEVFDRIQQEGHRKRKKCPDSEQSSTS